jgi:hypothetical protein
VCGLIARHPDPKPITEFSCVLVECDLFARRPELRNSLDMNHLAKAAFQSRSRYGLAEVIDKHRGLTGSEIFDTVPASIVSQQRSSYFCLDRLLSVNGPNELLYFREQAISYLRHCDVESHERNAPVWVIPAGVSSQGRSVAGIRDPTKCGASGDVTLARLMLNDRKLTFNSALQRVRVVELKTQFPRPAVCIPRVDGLSASEVLLRQVASLRR